MIFGRMFRIASLTFPVLRFSVLDLFPCCLSIKVRACVQRVASSASRLNVRDATISFAGFCRMVAAGAVTLFALHLLHLRHLCGVRFQLSSCVTTQATRFKFELFRHERVRRVSVLAV